MSDWIYTENLGDIRFWELKNWVAHILCLQGEVKFLYAGREFALHEHEVAVIGSPERMTSLNLSANFHCLSYIAPRTFLESQLPGSHYGIGGSVSLYENPILTLDAEQEQWLHDDLERIGNTEPQISRSFNANKIVIKIHTQETFHRVVCLWYE